MFFLFLGASEAFDSPELERFAAALEIAQTRYPAMTLSMLTTLLRVGMTPEQAGDYVSVSDIVTHTPVQKYPTIARQIDLLSAGHGKTVGLGLVDKQAGAADGRQRSVAISARGKMLLHELDGILSPDGSGEAGQHKDKVKARTKVTPPS